MKARSIASANGKQLDCELDENDGARDIPGWEEMTLIGRWRALSRKADELVVDWLFRHGDISKEYAQQRIREIRGQA